MRYLQSLFLLGLILGLFALGAGCASEPPGGPRDGTFDGESGQTREATDTPPFHYDPDTPTPEPF